MIIKKHFPIKSVLLFAILAICNFGNSYSQTTKAEYVNYFQHFEYNNTQHSGVNAFLLMLINHYAYPDRLKLRSKSDYDNHAKYEKAFRQRLDSSGISKFTFFYNEGTNIQGVVVSTDKFVIISFRGSDRFGKPQNFLQDVFLTDFHMRPTEIKINEKVMNVQSGFYKTYYQSNANFLQYLAEHGLTTRHEKKLFITGHSLGAAMSIWTAIDLQQKGFIVNGVYPFAQPNVGDKNFIEYYNSLNIPTFCYINRNDPIPMMLTNNWSSRVVSRHMNNCVYYSPGDQYRIFKSGNIEINTRPVFPFPNIFRHWMYEYCSAIYDFYIPKMGLSQQLPITPSKQNKH